MDANAIAARLISLREEINQLTQKHNKMRLYVFLSMAFMITGVFYLARNPVEYNLVPIDKTTFPQYSHTSDYGTYVQSEIACIQDIFSLVSSIGGMSPRENTNDSDSTELAEDSKESYDELKEQNEESRQGILFRYTYVIGKTVDDTTCILRTMRDGSNPLEEYLGNIDDLIYAALLPDYAEPRPVYGRISMLTSLSAMENKGMLSQDDSNMFIWKPEGMNDSDYYKLLEDIPVINLDDVDANKKVADPESQRVFMIGWMLSNLAAISLLIFGIRILRIRKKIRTAYNEVACITIALKNDDL